MPYVMISHKVANYAKWKRGVRAAAKWRKASGEKCFYACRNSKSPNDVMVWCEWDNAARMRKFLKSAELRKAMKAVGVTGKPEISIFDRMDILTAG
jgi:quinol monooxygenase YgiN